MEGRSLANTPPGSREDWNEMLDRIQNALADLLQRHPEPALDSQSDHTSRGEEPLAVLERRVAEVQEVLARAESSAADADAQLRAEMDSTQQWLTMLKQMSDTLANVAAPGDRLAS